MNTYEIRRCLGFLLATLLCSTFAAAQTSAPKFLDWAQTPPMGWNSWDSFGAGVTEAETREKTRARLRLVVLQFVPELLEPLGRAGLERIGRQLAGR